MTLDEFSTWLSLKRLELAIQDWGLSVAEWQRSSAMVRHSALAEVVTKDVPSQLTVKSEAGDCLTVSGYASTFDVDSDGDRILPGAFKESISKGNRLPFLWMHNAREPIGAVTQMYEDHRGLRFKAAIALDVSRAREAHALLKIGAINAISIGFMIPKHSSRYNGDVRELPKVDLMEISLVSLPANTGARLDPVN